MRYRPDTLEETHRMAARLDCETKDGGLGVNACPSYSQHVFVI